MAESRMLSRIGLLYLLKYTHQQSQARTRAPVQPLPRRHVDFISNTLGLCVISLTIPAMLTPRHVACHSLGAFPAMATSDLAPHSLLGCRNVLLLLQALTARVLAHR